MIWTIILFVGCIRVVCNEYSHSTNVDTVTRRMKLIGIKLQLLTNVRVVIFVTWFDTELFIGFIRYYPSWMVS